MLKYYIDLFSLFGFFAFILYAALSDASYYRIPNIVSLGIVAFFPLHVWASPTPVDWGAALLISGIGFVVGFGMFVRGWMGGGDVKLLSATMLWAGATLVAPQLLVMGIVGGVLAVGALAIHLKRRRASNAAAPRVPYGVAIAAGAGYAGLKMLFG
jgi:prepilin peptidase CpaA